jgi:hypothetical protein
MTCSWFHGPTSVCTILNFTGKKRGRLKRDSPGSTHIQSILISTITVTVMKLDSIFGFSGFSDEASVITYESTR